MSLFNCFVVSFVKQICMNRITKVQNSVYVGLLFVKVKVGTMNS